MLVVFWLHIGRITPIGAAHLIQNGVHCSDVQCAQPTALSLPWFSDIKSDATPQDAHLRFAFDMQVLPEQPYAFYFPKLADNLSIWLNGAQIREATTPRQLSNTPLLVSANSMFFKPGENTLRIQLNGRLTEGLELRRFYVGPKSLLAPHADVRTFFGPEMARHGMTLMTAFGVALLALWAAQRDERTFLWLGFSCFVACLFLAHYGLQNPLLPYKYWVGIWVMSISLYVYAILRFTTELLKSWYPNLITAYHILLALGTMVMIVAPEDYTFHLSFFINVASAVFANIVLYIIWVHRSLIRSVDFAIFFICLSVAVALGQYGFILHFHPSPPRTMHLFHFMPTVMSMSCLWLILARTMQSMRAQVMVVADQSRTIEEKTQELKVNFARLAEAEKQQAVATERGRIMADLHDGIGGQLVSTLSYIRNKQMDDPTLVGALEDVLRELALLVDSVGNDDDVVTLLGMLRTRLEGLLAQKGLTFD